MSGDVQPRKRKDKKKKKDDLGVEEPRGTAAVLGEGDVFIHSYHEHGTGGHWCAKIIFFVLLAILLGLIGLIILENRGLSELEANAVESKYSGMLEGWLEDAPDDDHHDEHTLELKHHDEDDHDEDGEDDEDEELEVEKIEQEPSDEEPISVELPALREEDDADDQDDEKESADDNDDDDADNADPDDDDDDDNGDDADDDFSEVDDTSAVVERVTAPAGKPFVEVEEDDDSTERPPDTLEEEEEYEKQQEELRKEEEQSSHMWLKLTVGGALLVATHAVVRRATARDVPEREESSTREKTPVIDRRMTLIPEEPEPVIPKKAPHQTAKPPQKIVEEVKKVAPALKSAPKKQPSEEPEEIDEVIEDAKNDDEDKELYSDEELEDEEEMVQIENAKTAAVESEAPGKTESEDEEQDADDEDVPDDVEIIDDEQLEEELEEEEDISDVDDVELLNRLEAKYGRLPEPDRPGPKHKDGGNSIDSEWPGEPADAYWRQQVDTAEDELQQFQDWLD